METKLQPSIEVFDVIPQSEAVTAQAEVLAAPFGSIGIMEEVGSEQFAPGRFATCTLTGVPADDIGSETGKK